MDLTASSAVNLPITSASARLVVVWIGARSIRCTYSGARVPPRFTFTTNLVFFMGFPLARDDKQMGGEISRLPFLSLTIRHRQIGWFLCGFAVSLGCEGLLAANINLDLLGLGFSLLGEVDLQHALIIVGAHLPWIHRTGQRERASEASVLPLDATEVLLFLFLLHLALAMDGEGVALDADINVFFVDARDFKLQSNVVLVFVDVHRRCEAGGG